MDPVKGPSKFSLNNSEAANSVPPSFVSLPPADQIVIKNISGPKITFGLVSDPHTLMENPSVITWGQNLLCNHLRIALSAWFGSAAEREHIQSEVYKDVSINAKELLDAIIKNEKDLKSD